VAIPRISVACWRPRDFRGRQSANRVSGLRHGTGTTDPNLLFISSHKLGPVAMDLNVGYTRRSGDGSVAPTSASVVGRRRSAVGWLDGC
jgi:hypothetical protein